MAALPSGIEHLPEETSRYSFLTNTQRKVVESMAILQTVLGSLGFFLGFSILATLKDVVFHSSSSAGDSADLLRAQLGVDVGVAIKVIIAGYLGFKVAHKNTICMITATLVMNMTGSMASIVSAVLTVWSLLTLSPNRCIANNYKVSSLLEFTTCWKVKFYFAMAGLLMVMKIVQICVTVVIFAMFCKGSVHWQQLPSANQQETDQGVIRYRTEMATIQSVTLPSNQTNGLISSENHSQVHLPVQTNSLEIPVAVEVIDETKNHESNRLHFEPSTTAS